MKRGATFSACGKYRHTLTRIWDATKPIDMWCLLNPSDAGADRDDPTSRRGVTFSTSWGSGGYVFVNAYDYISTDPRNLKHAVAPVSDDNGKIILATAKHCRDSGGKIILAWGANIDPYRQNDVVALLSGFDRYVLGLTAAGCPKHPLYLKSTTPLMLYARAHCRPDGTAIAYPPEVSNYEEA